MKDADELWRGPIDTKFMRDGEKVGLFTPDLYSSMTHLGRLGSGEEIANVVCFLLSDEASYVTGSTYKPRFNVTFR